MKVTFVTPFAFFYFDIYKYLYIYLQATTYTPVELLGPCFKTGRTVVSHSLYIFHMFFRGLIVKNIQDNFLYPVVCHLYLKI